MELEINKGLGWVPDLPDHRDYYLSLAPIANLPTKVDLRENDSAIFDQGRLGSCTAQAIAAAYMHNLKKQNEEMFVPSRLFIYWNERKMIDTVNKDSGAMIRDGIKSINVQGVCDETCWPYDISVFTKKPPRKCYREAKKHQSVAYSRVNRNLDDMKNCLASGLPFVLGFTVYESFYAKETAHGGMMKWPDKSERALGGHAVMAIGYDDSLEGGRFIIRNSWGTNWGDKGYFYMPYEYLTNNNLSADFWVIQSVE